MIFIFISKHFPSDNAPRGLFHRMRELLFVVFVIFVRAHDHALRRVFPVILRPVGLLCEYFFNLKPLPVAV